MTTLLASLLKTQLFSGINPILEILLRAGLPPPVLSSAPALLSWPFASPKVFCVWTVTAGTGAGAGAVGAGLGASETFGGTSRGGSTGGGT